MSQRRQGRGWAAVGAQTAHCGPLAPTSAPREASGCSKGAQPLGRKPSPVLPWVQSSLYLRERVGWGGVAAGRGGDVRRVSAVGGEAGESGAAPAAGRDGGAAASCSALLMPPLTLSGAGGGAGEKGPVPRGGECGEGSLHGGGCAGRGAAGVVLG